MNVVKYLGLAFIFGLFVAGPVVTVASPASVSAIAACDGRFAGIPPWYRGLTKKEAGAPAEGAQGCVIVNPEEAGGIQAFITKLALNIIEIGMVIVGYIALFFIIFGGFQFITNGSNPSAVEKARLSILHAVIGLAIALGSVAILNLIFGVIE
ncbi:MAG TPA: hypothetical protein QF549_02490 [Candidatus Saccharimonadaceae bacterium]|nr:hypothetical protein [Candidatus Saccharimonadaceae bacterium]